MFDWLAPGSYLGIVLFLTLTGIGLPVPEEVAIVAAGAEQGRGTPLVLRPARLPVGGGFSATA